MWSYFVCSPFDTLQEIEQDVLNASQLQKVAIKKKKLFVSSVCVGGRIKINEKIGQKI